MHCTRDINQNSCTTATGVITGGVVGAAIGFFATVGTASITGLILSTLGCATVGMIIGKFVTELKCSTENNIAPQHHPQHHIIAEHTPANERADSTDTSTVGSTTNPQS